jgi:8-oxo-dGTP pyrophosphatase MutT (NUDIX family)
MGDDEKMRKAARTIVVDEDSGKIAIVDVNNGGYHKIPGGGIETGETPETAAIREALEESGCDVEIIERLGELDFADPDDSKFIHHSVCFLARKINDRKRSYFTKEETERNFKLIWSDIDEAIKLFENPKSRVPFDLEMNDRDLKFIKLAKKYLSNGK